MVRSMPGASGVNAWSDSLDDRIKASRPTIPNWSITIPGGMFVTKPAEKSIWVNEMELDNLDDRFPVENTKMSAIGTLFNCATVSTFSMK